jgi:hypothetical protein
MNYLTMLEIADMLADSLDFGNITANSIDETQNKTIGIYQRADFAPRECIGTDSSYETAKVRLLLRWGNNPAEAEQKASETGGIIQALRDMPTAEHIIKFADLKAVRYLGKDEKGICEYAIDADIIYSERNEE